GRVSVSCWPAGTCGTRSLATKKPATLRFRPSVALRRLESGGAEEDRTPDLRIANATLSQLSYRPIYRLSGIKAAQLLDPGLRVLPLRRSAFAKRCFASRFAAAGLKPA